MDISQVFAVLSGTVGQVNAVLFSVVFFSIYWIYKNYTSKSYVEKLMNERYSSLLSRISDESAQTGILIHNSIEQHKEYIKELQFQGKQIVDAISRHDHGIERVAETLYELKESTHEQFSEISVRLERMDTIQSLHVGEDEKNTRRNKWKRN